MKHWLGALIEWAVDLGLDARGVYADDWQVTDADPEVRRMRCMQLLQSVAARATSARGIDFSGLPIVGEGIRIGWLPEPVVVLAYRMARVALVVAQVYGHGKQERHLIDDILCCMAVGLRLPEVRAAIFKFDGRSQSDQPLKAMGLSFDAVSSHVAAELIRRHQQVTWKPEAFTFAVEDAMHLLLLDAVGLAAIAYFEDKIISPEEVAELDAQLLARAQLAVWLTIAMLRLDDGAAPFVERLARFLDLPDSERDALMALPDGIDWELYRTYFDTPEERGGLIECLLTMAHMDGRQRNRELAFCLQAALELGVDRLDYQVLEQRVLQNLTSASSAL